MNAGPATAGHGSSIRGVHLIAFEGFPDERGRVSELYRVDWPELAAFTPRQWHLLTSRAGSLRGMHAHAKHDDLKIVLAGRVTLALADLRAGAPAGGGELLDLSDGAPVAVLIPAGVAHGVLSHTDSLVLVGSTQLYDPSDEFECAWDDPELALDWPAVPSLLSERDRTAGSAAELRRRLELALSA